MALLAYFLSTFLITWSVWFATAILAPPGNAGFFGIRGPVFLLGVFAPALVALALTARAEGHAGVKRLFARTSMNNTTGIVPAAVDGAMTPMAFRGSLVAWVTVGLLWVVAVPLLARMRRADIGAGT